MELKIETYKGAFGTKKLFVEIAIGIACCHFLAGCAKSEIKQQMKQQVIRKIWL